MIIRRAALAGLKLTDPARAKCNETANPCQGGGL